MSYYHDLDYDLHGIRSDLSNMNHQLSSGFTSIENGFDKVNLTFDFLLEELGELNQNMKTLVEEFIGFRTESYLQNEIRNQHLEQIELSLKNPMQTQAMEQFDIATTLLSRGNHKLALKHLHKAVELYPLHFRTYLHLSLTLITLKDYNSALDFAEQSINHAPVDSTFDYRSLSYQLIGKVYFHREEYEKAYQSIKRAIQFEATAENYYDYARYAALTYRHSEALSHLEKAILRKKELFASALLDCAIAFASMKEETASFLQDMKQKRKQFLNQLVTETDKVSFFKTNDIEKLFNSANIQSRETKQVTRRLTEFRKTLIAFKAAEQRKLSALLDEVRYFMEKNTYLDILEGIARYEALQNYVRDFPTRMNLTTDSLHYFSQESNGYTTMNGVEGKIKSLKKAVEATENTLKVVPLFDFSERKALKAKKQETLATIKSIEQTKRAVETDLQLLSLLSSSIKELKKVSSANARPIVKLDLNAVLSEETKMTQPPPLSERIALISDLIDSELAAGETISWNKSERDEWIGSTNWVLLIDSTLNELRKRFIPLVGRNIQIGESWQFTEKEIICSSYTNFRMQLPSEQLTEGHLLDETGKIGEQVLRFIDWNGEKLAVEEKYAQIARTRRVFAATAEGPVSFGDNNRFIVTLTRY